VRVQPGIFFTDDPAFGGQPRELVAADYAYSIRRLADPATKSPGWSSIEQAGISGLAALRREAVDRKTPFDYDRPIDGLRCWTATRCASGSTPAGRAFRSGWPRAPPRRWRAR
jgi:hypothetical protein